MQRQLYGETVDAELDLAAGSRHDPRRTALLRHLDLDTLRERHPLSLSGGQQQRLVIATACLTDRPVIVLDEPGTGVDAHHLTAIADLLTDQAAQGRTVLVISHDDRLIDLAADHEVVLNPRP